MNLALKNTENSSFQRKEARTVIRTIVFKNWFLKNFYFSKIFLCIRNSRCLRNEAIGYLSWSNIFLWHKRFLDDRESLITFAHYIRSMLITFFDSKGIIHKDSLWSNSYVYGNYYLEVLKRLISVSSIEI